MMGAKLGNRMGVKLGEEKGDKLGDWSGATFKIDDFFPLKLL